jgi:hypothetical protein
VSLPSATPLPPATAPTVLPTTLPTVTATAAATVEAVSDEETGENLEHGPLPAPTPRATAVTQFPCTPGNWRLRYDVEQRLPLDVPITPAHFAFYSPENLYMTVDNWVGLIHMQQPFTLDNPRNIWPIRFVEVPELPIIADIEVQHDVAFIAGGSQLLMAHTDVNCYLVPIVTTEFSFEVQAIEMEADRLYVGGMADGLLHVEILDRHALPEIVSLGIVTFEPAEWSVVGEEILTLDLDNLTLAATNVADPKLPETRKLTVPLDREWPIIPSPQLVEDNLSVVVLEQGLLSITGLLDPNPVMTWHELDFYFTLRFHEAQEEHLFVGANFCDMGNCGSSVSMTTRNPEDALSRIDLYPHHPVNHYYAVNNDVIFAFSDYSLIIIDLAAPEGQEIVRTYPLR